VSSFTFPLRNRFLIYLHCLQYFGPGWFFVEEYIESVLRNRLLGIIRVALYLRRPHRNFIFVFSKSSICLEEMDLLNQQFLLSLFGCSESGICFQIMDDLTERSFYSLFLSLQVRQSAIGI